jgi:dihydrofolate synthase/folylpolyglutamate synthase
MKFATLDAWLAWQEQLHPSSIDMGLERVHGVQQAMDLSRPAPLVITVGGTNGKGSTVAMLEAILLAAGYRVGAYTSPHMLHYAERVRVNGVCASEAQLCAAFERVDAARGQISLTYFEFGTLAALDIFSISKLDVAVLEVGMGGRLDAVNVVDADVAVVTSVDIDHTAWLGVDRESIGYEKAGIFRAERPAVCGDRDPPASLVDHAARIGAPLHVYGRDFWHERNADSWRWCGPSGAVRTGLPFPALRGDFQLQNASSVLAALDQLTDRLPVAQNHIREGLLSVALPGRFQVVTASVPTIVDVAHNPHAARALAATLRAHACSGRTFAVFAMLADKNIGDVAGIVDPVIDEWHGAGLDVPRGASALQLAEALARAHVHGVVVMHESVAAAYAAARARASAQDRIVVFGSFFTVSIVVAAGIE